MYMQLSKIVFKSRYLCLAEEKAMLNQNTVVTMTPVDVWHLNIF